MELVSKAKKDELEKIKNKLEKMRQENREITQQLSEIIAHTASNEKDLERLKQIQSKLLASS